MRCDRCDEMLPVQLAELYAEDGFWGCEILCGKCADEDAAENAKNAERRNE